MQHPDEVKYVIFCTTTFFLLPFSLTTQNAKCFFFKNLSQYWTFHFGFPFSYRSSNFAIAKAVTLIIFLLKFLYHLCTALVHDFFSVLLPIIYRSFIYCECNNCRSLTLLKRTVKRNRKGMKQSKLYSYCDRF